MKLYTTQEMFEELHKLADTKAKAVKVPRASLMALLMDHGRLIAAVEAFHPDLYPGPQGDPKTPYTGPKPGGIYPAKGAR